MNETNSSNNLDNSLKSVNQSLGHSSPRVSRQRNPRRATNHKNDPSGLEPAAFVLSPVIQNATMTWGAFVETKFIPGHVQHKTIAGQTHYQAMLKHLMRPETVHRMFNPRNVINVRLQSIPDWPYLDEVRLCDLKAEHIRKLVAAAFARDYSWQTVKHIKNVAYAIVAHAQQEGCFQGPNPIAQVKLPPKTHRPTPNLSIEQTRAILQLLPSPERHVALFTLSTGMNIQEICNLQWKHVNLTDSPRFLLGDVVPPYSMAVRMQWNPAGLGASSQNRNRNLAIPIPLYAVLAEWALERAMVDQEECVLLSEAGQPIAPADLRLNRLTPIGRKLGIPWLSWRVLCRAHAVLLTEFRPQLDYLIGNAGLGGTAAVTPGNQPQRAVFATESDTIGPKFSHAVPAAPPLGWQT